MLIDVPSLIPYEDEATMDEINAALEVNKNWETADYKCRHMIVKTLFDSFFNQFAKKTKAAKELWDVAIKVCKGETIGSKKFHVQNYREYKMVDYKSVLEQAKDFQKIADAITAAGMYLDPVFHVNALISTFSNLPIL